jgi:hypothetical protein
MRRVVHRFHSLKWSKIVTVILALVGFLSLTGAGYGDSEYEAAVVAEFHGRGETRAPIRLNSLATVFRIRQNEGRVYNPHTEYPPLWSTHPFNILSADLLIARKDSGACTPIQSRQAQLWVVEFTGSGESQYENIRNSDLEVQSVIPTGSLVMVRNPELMKNGMYMPVQVVSRAPFRPDKPVDEYLEDEPFTMDGKPLADWREQGYIYVDSLHPIQGYALDLGDNDYTDHATQNGYDFSESVFVAQVDRDGREKSLDCADNNRGSSYTEYKLFSLLDRETLEVVNEIAISLNDPALLYSASAVPIENEDLRDPIRKEEERQENMLEAFFRGSAELLDYLSEEDDPEGYAQEEQRLDDRHTLRNVVGMFVDVPGVDVFDGPQYFKACSLHDDLNVRDRDGNRVGTLPPNAPIRLLQSYEGSPTYEFESGGETHDMYHIQGLDENGNLVTGYASSEIVMSSQDCEAIHEARREFLDSFQLPGPIESIEDDNCCVYPLIEPHENSFVPGDISRFGAPRKARGSTHPGCDMYGDLEDPIMAVAPGIIKHFNRGYTWLNTTTPRDCAVAVTHLNSRGEPIFEADYGEVYCNIFQYNPSTDQLVSRTDWPGARVEDGEQFLIIGDNKHASAHMLHLELYEKVRLGAPARQASYSSVVLGGNRGRRGDLRDCNADIEKWFRMQWPDEDI